MTATDYDAVIVGSGPNGLAAAITLATEGASVLVVEAADRPGGGSRSEELTLPGFVHDTCSAIHPLGKGSPYLRTLPLERYGLEWLDPEIEVAQPLDDGTAAVLVRDVAETGRRNGDPDGWERLMGPVVAAWEGLEEQLLGPPLHLPGHPVDFVRFGLRALWPASWTSRTLRSPRSKALLAGIAAHAMAPLSHLLTSAPTLVLAAAGHTVGWPVARGGSQRIADAMVSHLEALGGKLEVGRPITSLDQLPRAKAVLLTLSPWQVADVAGARLPESYRRRLRGVRHGWASFKVDYALDGPMPWTAEECRRAGTVHVGGVLADVVASEAAVGKGRVSDRPFVLVGQQSVVDPSRAPAGKHTLWAYCHVPLDSKEDVTDRIEGQLDRFAPGWRDLVLARAVKNPQALGAWNPNFAGGDITCGAPTGFQLLFRPTFSLRPYATPAKGLYICSGATPPGPGVHGMCGHLAARAALARM